MCVVFCFRSLGRRLQGSEKEHGRGTGMCAEGGPVKRVSEGTRWLARRAENNAAEGVIRGGVACFSTLTGHGGRLTDSTHTLTHREAQIHLTLALHQTTSKQFHRRRHISNVRRKSRLESRSFGVKVSI